MSNASDFVIENGVLKKYTGPGGDVVIPDGVTSIGDDAFFLCKGLTSIEIPEGTDRIGKGAFSLCKNLARVSIPNSVKEIGGQAFSFCESLKHAVIPDGITIIKNSTFYECRSLKSITIPDGVTCIEDEAFGYCVDLPEVKLPDRLISLGIRAFYTCKKLTTVSIPERVTSIGLGAFSWCDSLQSVSIPDGVTSIGERMFEHSGSLTDVVIPERVTELGERAFAFCSSLKQIAIPEGVTSIAPELFKNCDSLETVNIPDGVTEIGKEAFFGCLNLKSVRLPDRIAKIGESAFACCPALYEITVSDAAEKYRSEDGVLFSKDGKKLFVFPAGHRGETYTVPDHTEQITPSAFFGAEQLKQITLPQSLKSIGGNAFKRTGLRFATVPKSVAKLPQKAFQSSTREEIGFQQYVDRIVPFVAVYVPETVGALVHPVYIGGPLSDLPAKLKNAAVNGFFYALQHEVTEILPYKQSYLDHIRKNSKTYAKQAETDEYVLHVMIEEDLLKQQEIETLLEAYDGKDRPDIIAELLDVQQARFGGRKDDLSLSDNDPEMKRRMKMEARREAIRNQKGIKGIVFVCTGRLESFGYYDDYTGAKDMSDLKDYIEKRGGFYRSAVSSNTDYLICNDPNSNSVKSKKAKELGVPVIPEDLFLKMAEEKA